MSAVKHFGPLTVAEEMSLLVEHCDRSLEGARTGLDVAVAQVGFLEGEIARLTARRADLVKLQGFAESL